MKLETERILNVTATPTPSPSPVPQAIELARTTQSIDDVEPKNESDSTVHVSTSTNTELYNLFGVIVCFFLSI